jgi:hypothetical protein
MNPDDERLAKLPVWARNTITDLHRQRDEARTELQQTRDMYEGQLPGADTFLEPEVLTDGRPLGKRPTVRFVFGDPDARWPNFHQESIEARHFGSYVEIRAGGTPNTLIVQPHSSNVLRVRAVGAAADRARPVPRGWDDHALVPAGAVRVAFVADAGTGGAAVRLLVRADLRHRPELAQRLAAE